MTEKEKIDNLLKPRYRLIADYPGNDTQVGLIYTYGDKKGDRGYQSPQDWCKLFDAYPTIFRHLFWWQERAVEEMPEYVWYDKQSNKGLVVLKVKEWILEPDGDMWASVEEDEIGFACEYMPTPATESEYFSCSNAGNKK